MAAVLLASALLTPLTASAAAKPSIVTGTVWTDYYCDYGGVEDVCWNISDGEVPLLTVSGKRFAAYAPVSITVTTATGYVVDRGATTTTGSGTFSYETDVQLCNGVTLPYIVQAYDWLSGRYSNAAIALVC